MQRGTLYWRFVNQELLIISWTSEMSFSTISAIFSNERPYLCIFKISFFVVFSIAFSSIHSPKLDII